ncbi:hydrogenase nickel incorporation protein HypB [Tepidimonas sp. HKU79]|uniref:hydrogenase nickel incorporation protein HypB n=1 Tax=unclassified Tepidimonas TaxID=2631705 RepID=UPI003C7ECDB7
MCVVCGCSEGGAGHAHHAMLGQQADAAAAETARDTLHFGTGVARVSVPGLSQERAIRLERDILGANDRVAQQNRAHFRAHGVSALNLVSSPGSGKTTLLCATIEALRQQGPQWEVAVIEGDQQTSFDAERIRATGVPAIQVNTGKGCHLDAPMVAEAFARLHAHFHHHGDGHEHGHAAVRRLLFIENVGNLVCPAMWDLGETAKVAVLSVTEGDDKPLKYPDMFAAARLMIINKVDLLPHVRFDVNRCIEMARRVNPTIEVIALSATSGEGMPVWQDWLARVVDGEHRQASEADAEALRARISRLEAELAQARAALAER